MKQKICTILVLVTMLLSLCTALPVSAAANLIKNGDFEASGVNPLNWYLGGGTIENEFRLDKTEKHGGAQSFSITNSGSAVLYANQAVTQVTPEGEYKLSVWAKTDRTNEASIKLEFYSINTITAGYSTGPEKMLDFPAATDWKEFTLDFTAPANTKMIAVFLRNYGAGTLWLDDIYLIQVGGAMSGEKGESIAANGSFENLNDDGSLADWRLGGGALGSAFQIIKSGAHSGSNAVKIKNENSSILYLNQQIRSAQPGMAYEMSVWVNTTAATGAAIKAEFYNRPETFSSANSTGPEALLQIPSTDGKWQQFTKGFIVPEGTKSIVVYCRFYGIGEVLFDDFELCPVVSPSGESEEVPVGDIMVKSPVAGTGNLLKNADFENGLTGWVPRDPAAMTDGRASITTEKVHGGKNALMQNALNGTIHSMGQNVKDIEAGAEYQATAWVNIDQLKSGDVCFRASFWKGYEETTANWISVTNVGGKSASFSTSGWQLIEYSFTAPEDCVMVTLFLANYGNGIAYYDDVSLVMTKAADPLRFNLETDWVFYYTDWKTGTATVTFKKGTTQKAIFTLLDDGKEIDSYTATDVGEVSYNFDTSLLAEKGKEYIISATLEGSNEKRQASVYRYDRPEALREDGVYMADGKPFYPVVTTTVPDKSHYKALADLGINVTTVYLESDFDEALAEAQKYGIKLIPLLYFNMKPAGHPDNQEVVKNYVQKYKDNPNIFAWKTMDEPIGNHTEFQLMVDSYKLIRDIDTKHPVYVTEPGSEVTMRTMSKYCDLMVSDSYIALSGKPTNITRQATITIERSVRAGLYKRPVYSLLQAYDWYGYWPTVQELRHSAYESLMEGAQSVGYYRYADTKDGKNLNETDIAEGLRLFNKTELPEAMHHFVTGDYPMFCEYKGDGPWYRGWVKDGSIYLIVLSRDDSADSQATIDLTSFDGKINLSGYKAEVIAGAAARTFSSDGSTMTVPVPTRSAVLYKITPKEKVDFSGLTGVKYLDLQGYDWARPAIEALRAKGIVNSMTPHSYAPGKDITRADFAMFLVRALGLSADGSDNFADVAADAYYAKELAAGYTHGILKGVGDNKFNPQARITRQDMMTMLARALNLSGDADLSVFQDSDSIADYAVESVKAVIEKGLIKGNESGMLNPLGNTTRAETAVIMARLMEL